VNVLAEPLTSLPSAGKMTGITLTFVLSVTCSIMNVVCSMSMFHKNSEDSVDGRIILKEVFKKYDRKTLTDFTWFRVEMISGELF
jgi:hypothetical protein